MTADHDEPDSPAGRPGEPPPPELGDLLARHRDRLRLMVALRLDRRLLGRLDPSDVVQEAYLEAAQRWDDYRAHHAATLAPYLWLRLLTSQRLLIAYRHHLGARARDAGRERSLDEPAAPEVSSVCLAAQLLDSGTTPSQALQRAEREAALRDALERMSADDREVLTLRHFEHLSNADAAQVLGVPPGTASQRYYRALKRLREALDALPGGWEGSGP